MTGDYAMRHGTRRAFFVYWSGPVLWGDLLLILWARVLTEGRSATPRRIEREREGAGLKEQREVYTAQPRAQRSNDIAHFEEQGRSETAKR